MPSLPSPPQVADLRQLRLFVLVAAGVLLGLTALCVALRWWGLGGGAGSGGDAGQALFVVLLALVPAELAAWLAMRRGLRERVLSERAALAAAALPAGVRAVSSSWAALRVAAVAMVEGTGIFAGVVYFLTDSAVALGLMGLALVLVLALLPREGRRPTGGSE